MAQLSASQIANYAYGAGFRGNALVMAVAISFAESGGNSTAIGHNSNGSSDYGLWQINSSHSQYNPTLLINNPAYNAGAAYTLSSNGSSWRPWCTAYSDAACGTKGGTYLGSGAPYQKFLPQAQAAVLGSASPSTPAAQPQPKGVPLWCQPFMQHDVAWWEANGHHYPKDWGAAEGGVDWNPVPLNAPITALLPGVVVGSGYFDKPTGRFCMTSDAGSSGHGVVTIRSINPYPNLVPGTLIDIYYQHIIIDPSIGLTCSGAKGQVVSAGQKIGNGNGVFNVEVGINVGTDWGHIWGGQSPGPHVDPIPYLYTLIGSGTVPAGSIYGLGGLFNGIVGGFGVSTSPPKTYTPLLDQVHQTLVDTPGFYGIALALDEAEQFPGWIDLTQPASVDIPISAFGISTGDIQLPVPDITGTARSIGATITDNFVPFVIRGGLVVLGSVLFMMLLGKALLEPVEKIVPLALEAAA